MRNIEVFDPLGLRSNQELFKKYLPFDSININDFNVQELNSNTCAHFCIYFLCMRFFNGKIAKSIMMFSICDMFVLISEDLDFKFFMETFFDIEDTKKNEETVRKFVSSI